MIWFVAAAVALLILLAGLVCLLMALTHQPAHLGSLSLSSVLWAPVISFIVSLGLVIAVGRPVGYILRAILHIDRQDTDIARVGVAILFVCWVVLLWGTRHLMRVQRTRLLRIGDALSLSGVCIGILALVEIATDADCVGYQAADLPCPY